MLLKSLKHIIANTATKHGVTKVIENLILSNREITLALTISEIQTHYGWVKTLVMNQRLITDKQTYKPLLILNNLLF